MDIDNNVILPLGRKLFHTRLRFRATNSGNAPDMQNAFYTPRDVTVNEINRLVQ